MRCVDHLGKEARRKSKEASSQSDARKTQRIDDLRWVLPSVTIYNQNQSGFNSLGGTEIEVNYPPSA